MHHHIMTPPDSLFLIPSLDPNDPGYSVFDAQIGDDNIRYDRKPTGPTITYVRELEEALLAMKQRHDALISKVRTMWHTESPIWQSEDDGVSACTWCGADAAEWPEHDPGCPVPDVYAILAAANEAQP